VLGRILRVWAYPERMHGGKIRGNQLTNFHLEKRLLKLHVDAYILASFSQMATLQKSTDPQRRYAAY